MMKNYRHNKKCVLMIVFQLFFSCSELVEVEDITDEVVIITAPTDQSNLDDSNVVFTWEPINEAESYHLQVATPSFIDAAQVLVDTLVINFNYAHELYFGQFEWRVKGQNSAYQTQYTTQSFTIEE
jgi:hypothetical protein